MAKVGFSMGPISLYGSQYHAVVKLLENATIFITLVTKATIYIMINTIRNQ